MNIISFASQKGGVGKTTSVLAYGEKLNSEGKRILYIDLDAQLSLTTSLKAVQSNGKTALEVLTGKADIKDAIVKTKTGDVLPSNTDLADIDEQLGKGIKKYYRLKEILEGVKNDYDYCLIDCPPSLSTLPMNALTASDYVIIPLKADYYSILALEQFMETYEAIKEYSNPNIHILGILLTMYNTRTTVNKLMYEQIKERADAYGIKIIDPPIRRSISLEEAQFSGSIFTNKNNAYIDYSEAIANSLEGVK